MQHEFSPNTGLMFTESEMLELAERTTSQPLISFAADSHAKISAMPESVSALAASDRVCGLNLPESFANYDPTTCLWRTSQLSLDGGYQLFSETFPRSGLMRNGIAYRQHPLVRRIGATEFSSWPTPTRGAPLCGGAGAFRKMRQLCNQGVITEEERKNLVDPRGGESNPALLEWLMGFPIGWTDLMD